MRGPKAGSARKLRFRGSAMMKALGTDLRRLTAYPAGVVPATTPHANQLANEENDHSTANVTVSPIRTTTIAILSSAVASFQRGDDATRVLHCSDKADALLSILLNRFAAAR